MENNKKLRINLISLGCPKNLVDSEAMLGILHNEGFCVADEIRDADAVIVNTCGFISDAKKESLDIISDLIELKRKGALKKIIVAGCLAQRYETEMKKELPEVDCFIGTNEFARIGTILRSMNGERKSFISPPQGLYDYSASRKLLTPPHYAYLKISEGCDNRCGYCVIPALRGKLRSRQIEQLVKEARALASGGNLKEINLVSQDSANYGVDLCGRQMIAGLLGELCRIEGTRWIRLLYNHPAHISDGLIDVMSREPKICKYIDLPIQHINDGLLQAMNRNISKREVISLISRIRKAMPNVALRTAFIVGLPGETEKEFNELADFIKEIKFERLGAFAYSREEGTPAYGMPDQVPEEVKTERLNRIMALQREISEEINQKYLGMTLDVLMDERDENDPNLYLGRTYMDAPEVDGTVFAKGNCKVGKFARVKIVDTYEYDLVGEVVHSDEPAQ